MLRLWLLPIALLLGGSSVWAQVPLNQPVSWTGNYIPVVVNDPRFANQAPNTVDTSDPYALVAVRRSLPWLGGNVGAAPIPAPSATRLGDGGGIFGNRFGLLSNRPRLFGGSLLGGPGQGGPSGGNFVQGGNLFPGVYNTINSRLWLRGEWLYWDTKGMETPVLVTTSTAGTPQATAGVLGEAGVANLFGGGDVNGSTVGGFRVSGGFWITPQQNFGIEGEFFRINEQNSSFNGNSDGSVILARPFFDITGGQETAQLISFPGLVSGNIQVNADTNFRSFLVNGRASLCPTHGCNSCGQPDRVDWIIGYRRVELDDTITVNENLNSLVAAAPGTIALTDRFSSKNEFNGLQLGIIHRSNFQRAWLESMLRVAVGSNQQTVRINGNQSITEAGLTDNFTGGLLAQRTNIGNHRRNDFSMIPEIGVRLGARLTNRLSASVGYNVIYFPNVVRAGMQIDTDVNPGLIQPEVVPLTGALRPRFRFVESDYWAHGLTVGGELSF